MDERWYTWMYYSGFDVMRIPVHLPTLILHCKPVDGISGFHPWDHNCSHNQHRKSWMEKETVQQQGTPTWESLCIYNRWCRMFFSVMCDMVGNHFTVRWGTIGETCAQSWRKGLTQTWASSITLQYMIDFMKVTDQALQRKWSRE